MLKRNRTIAWILCLVLLCGAIAGCGSSSTPTPSTGDPATTDESNTSVGDAGTLVIYNCNSEDWTAPVIKEFQELTGIKVENIAGTSGELMARIRSEAENPLADIMWGGTHDSHLALIDYLEPYESSEKEFINPDFVREDNAFYHITMDPYVLAYNTDLVSDEEAPKVWADLLDPKWKGKISMTDPSKSTSVYSCMITMMKTMGGGMELMEQLIENLDGRMTSGSSAMVQALSDGEYHITAVYEEPANKYVNNGAHIKIVYPEDGTMVITGCIAIVKDAKNMENAQKFIDFAMSKEVHEKFDSHSRRSTRVDVEPPKEMTPLSEIKYVPFDAQYALDFKEEFMSEWQAIIEK